MQKLKQIALILIILTTVIAIFTNTPTSKAEGEENLTLTEVVGWISSGSQAYMDMDPVKMLQYHSMRTGRIEIGPGHHDIDLNNIRTNDCLSDNLTNKGNPAYAKINTIIDVDSDGSIYWYQETGENKPVTNEQAVFLRQLARYAVGQDMGHADSYNVGKFVTQNMGIANTFFTADAQGFGGPLTNQAREIPENYTVRFMEIVFYNTFGEPCAQHRLYHGTRFTPQRECNLYLQKVNENGKTQGGAYFRLKHVKTGKYIQVADLDAQKNPTHGYVGMEDTLTWVSDEDIKQHRRKILYTDVQKDATIFVTNQYDGSGAIYVPGIEGGEYDAEEIRNDNLGYALREDMAPWQTVKTFRISAGNGTQKVVIKNDSPYSNLRLIKVDKDGKTLPNVHFKIKRLAGGALNFDSYLQVVDLKTGLGIVDGQTITGVGHESLKNGELEIKYTPTESDATEFVTNGKGEIYIGMILEGNYEAIEIANDDPKYFVDKTPHPFEIRWGMEHEEQVTIENVEGDPPSIIELEKVDEEDNSIKLANVHFTFKRTGPNEPVGYLRVVTNGQPVSGPITGVGKGSGTTFEYVENESDATDFVTGGNGTILIYGPVAGWYEAHETKNENPDYEESDQTVTFYAMPDTDEDLDTPTKITVYNSKDIPPPSPSEPTDNPEEKETKFTKLIKDTSVPLEDFHFQWREKTIREEYVDDYPDFFDPSAEIYQDPVGDVDFFVRDKHCEIQLAPDDKLVPSRTEPRYEITKRIPKTRQVQSGTDSDGNPTYRTESYTEYEYGWVTHTVEWKCTTHGYVFSDKSHLLLDSPCGSPSGEAHCNAYNTKKANTDALLWEQMEKYHAAREKGVDEVNSHPYTDKKGEIDITPLEPEGDDHLGQIEQRELDVGWNPYFNKEDHENWELIDPYWEDVTWYDKRRRMDIEGYVWEDIPAQGKEGTNREDTDGKFGPGDRYIYPVSVELKDNQGTIGQGVITANGMYRIRVGGKDGKDLDRMLSHLDQCYLEFTYNGLKYQSVYPAWSSTESIALEDKNVRKAFNEKLKTIVSNAGDTKSNNVPSGNVKINFNKNGSYARKIDYEGKVLSFSGTSAEPIGDGRYSGTQKMRPSSVIDDLTPTEQNAPHKYDKGNPYANNCYTYSSKTATEQTKYQISATTKVTNWDGIKKYTVAEDRISGANFGVYEREQPDISLVNDVERAVITMNGESYLYQYGEKTSSNGHSSVDDMLKSPKVKFGSNTYYNDQDKSKKYRREIHGEHIAIKQEEQNNEDTADPFKMTIFYRTTIKNESTCLTMGNIELMTHYDLDYNDTNNSPKDWSSDSDFTAESGGATVTWSKQSIVAPGVATSSPPSGYNIAFGKIKCDPLGPGESVTIFTSYTATRETFIDLVRKQNDESGFVYLNNNIEVNSYTTTYPETERFSDIGEAYAGVDKDSAAGNSDPSDEEGTYEDDNDEAPTLQVSLGQVRSLSGNVFEDIVNASDPGTREKGLTDFKGDGYFDDGEKGISGVKVELIEIGEDGKEITDDEGNTKVLTYDWKHESSMTPHVAVYFTGSSGEYKFDGFIPGEYIVRFTWGQNVIYSNPNDKENASDNRVSKAGEDTLYVQQYKSTVYVDQARYEASIGAGEIQKNVGADSGTKSKWYLGGLEANKNKKGYSPYQKYSNAIDDMETRKKIDDQTAITGQDHGSGALVYGDLYYTEEGKGNANINLPELATSMESRTPAFDVGVEEVQDNGESITDKSTGKTYDKFEVKDLDFGISKRPETDMTLEKRVERVKLTLANGMTVVDTTLNWNKEGTKATLKGNTQSASYPRQRDKGREDTGLFKIEMDQEILQGAMLEITYKYTIKNNSFLDYKVVSEGTYNAYEIDTTSNKYYKYGERQAENEEVVISPTKILEYLDNKLGYIRKFSENAPSENDSWEEKTEKQRAEIERLLYDGTTNELIEKMKKAGYYNNYNGIDISVNGVDKKGTDDIKGQLDNIYKMYRTILRDTTIENAKKLRDDGYTVDEISLKAQEKWDKLKFVASKQLSDTATDLNFYNVVEIAQTNKTGGAIPERTMFGDNDATTTGPQNVLGTTPNWIDEYDYSITPEHDGDYASVITIVPPTGDNDKIATIAWIILGVSSLGILGAGIVLIKKLVLNGRKNKV